MSTQDATAAHAGEVFDRIADSLSIEALTALARYGFIDRVLRPAPDVSQERWFRLFTTDQLYEAASAFEAQPSKLCAGCDEVKPLVLFTKNGDGRHSYCKSCRREYMRDWRAGERGRRRVRVTVTA